MGMTSTSFQQNRVINLSYQLLLLVKDLQIMQKNPSIKSIYFTTLQKHPKYQSEIKPILQNLQAQKYQKNQIIDVLVVFNEKYCWRRKQPSYKKKIGSPYRALLDIYSSSLPQLCKFFASALLKIKPQSIPLLMGSIKSKINYGKTQILYMMLLMFFSLTPKQYYDGRQYLENKFNNVNTFYHVLSESQFKTLCIVQYLKITVKQFLNTQKNNEVFTICRNVEKQPDIQKIILHKQKKMTLLTIQSNNRSIQQFNGDIKVDFANRFIGGGCLTNGCVQEQIMFAVHPQLLVTTLLCQKMEDNEAIAFIGFKRYFQYRGYANTTSFDGRANVKYNVSQNGQTRQFITAIDAIKFKQGGKQQYQKKFIDRQIMKAFVGFSALGTGQRIITGGWGCGVYNGDVQIKVIIQWIAATLADKQIVICPFGKKKVYEEYDFLMFLKDKTVKEVYQILIEIAKVKNKPEYGKESLYSIANGKL